MSVCSMSKVWPVLGFTNGVPADNAGPSDKAVTSRSTGCVCMPYAVEKKGSASTAEMMAASSRVVTGPAVAQLMAMTRQRGSAGTSSCYEHQARYERRMGTLFASEQG